MNKFKLSLIAIATLVASNTNAQTFYQCVPNACPSGQYFDGANCKNLPTHTACASGQYFDGVNCKNLPSQKLPCFYVYTSLKREEEVSTKGAKSFCSTNVFLYGCFIILTDGDSIRDEDKIITCNNGKLQ